MANRVVALVLLFAATSVAQAPIGFKTYENKLSKLSFYYPTAYKEMPVPPTEQLLVAKFVLEKTPRELKKVSPRLLAAARLTVNVFMFEGGEAPLTGEGDGGEATGPETIREAMERRSRVTSWEQFEKRLGWQLAPVPGKEGTYAMSGRRRIGSMSLSGRLVRKQVGNKVFGVYAHTLQPHAKKLDKIVDTVGKSLDLRSFDGAADRANQRIDRIYRKSKLVAIEWRKKIRRNLAKGWRAVDTDNYIIVHHTKSTGLIKRIARDVEAIRSFYMQMFPPVEKVEKVSVLRLCETREEYYQYGGPPNTGGYWHPGNEELVLFDYSYTQKKLTAKQKKAMGGRRLSSKDSMLVMRHEAFHQYIFYAIGEFSPHDWFNEGYGDYFSGAIVHGYTGRVAKVQPSPWRIHRAKDMCEHGQGFLPLKKILNAERSTFYNRARIGDYYAGAWAFVYFLKESKEAKAHPRWSKLLDTYFHAVKDCYRDELKQFGDRPSLANKQVAGFNARKAALKLALEGIDLAELEGVWREWIIDLRDPWPSLRKKRKK